MQFLLVFNSVKVLFLDIVGKSPRFVGQVVVDDIYQTGEYICYASIRDPIHVSNYMT